MSDTGTSFYLAQDPDVFARQAVEAQRQIARSLKRMQANFNRNRVRLDATYRQQRVLIDTAQRAASRIRG